MRGVRDCVAKLILLLNMSNATGTETNLSLEGGEEGRMKAHQKKKKAEFLTEMCFSFYSLDVMFYLLSILSIILKKLWKIIFNLENLSFFNFNCL